MATGHDLGRDSEALAAEYLESRGYDIIERNYRVGHKEVDLIVQRGDLVAFVEVKAKAGKAYGHPLEAITWAKRREIAYVARVWTAAHGRGYKCRFDAIAIVWNGSVPEIEHVPNAWML